MAQQKPRKTQKVKEIISAAPSYRPSRDNEFVSLSTVEKVEFAAKMITKGKSKATIIETLQENYNLGYDQAYRYYLSGMRFLIPKDTEKFREGLIQANIERLEKIIEANIDEHPKVAKDAISELNKMLGIGTNSIQVGVKNNPDDNTSEFMVVINQ